MELNEAINKRIDYLCEEKGISISDLISNSVISQSTMSEIRSGKSKYPRLSTLKSLSEGFGITLSDFFNHDVFTKIDIDDIK